jgi:hypothetical protein
MCDLEDCQLCGELCFAGAATSLNGRLPQIPRLDILNHYISNESFVEGQFNVTAQSLTLE